MEGSAADAKAVGDALEKKLENTDIVDNLTTSDSKKVLSAKQGNVLKKSVDDLRVNTEESIGSIEQHLTNIGVTVEEAKNSAENAATNADNAQAEAEKKVDPDGSVAMTANFDMGNHNINNLADPVEETDAANKKYVDEAKGDTKAKIVSATLSASMWSTTTSKAPYSQKIAVEGLTDGVKAKVWAVFEGDSAKDKPKMEACACVNTAIRGDGEIIFTCFDKRPETDIVVMVELYHGDTADGECIPMLGFGSGGGGLSMVQLWTNASPSSEFAGQTIPLDLNGYDAIYVITDQTSVYVKNGSWRNINGFEMYDNTRNVYVRSVDFLANGAKFGDCRSVDFKNLTSINTKNSINKPTNIYGIKGVSV